MNLFASFSLIPLNFIAVTGFAISMLGMAYAMFLVGRLPFSTIGVSLGEATIVILLSLGGLQLLSIGLVGQYVGRLLLTANGKPQYRERKILGRSDSIEINSRITEQKYQTKNAA